MKNALTSLVSGIAAFLACTAEATVDLDNGLVTWFSFDGFDSNGKVENKASAERPLSIVSGATLDYSDAIGGASLSFAGALNQMATFKSPALPNCTVSFWYRRGENDGPYVEANNTANPYIFASLGQLHCNAPHSNRNITFLDRNWATIATTNNVAMPATWMHYAFSVNELSREGGNSTVEGKLYINGYLYLTVTKTINGMQPTSSATTTLLGNISAGNRPPMFKMDEFRVWNRVISDEEVFAEYERTAADSPGTLLAYWDMDGITAGAVADKSAMGSHPLTLGSAVTVTSDAVEGNALSFINSSSSWGRTDFTEPLSDMTFSLWINPAVVSSATGPRILDGLGGGYAHAQPAANNFSLTVKDPCASSAFTFDGGTEPWCPVKGAWTHLALVRKTRRQSDGTFTMDVIMYVNGVKSGERKNMAISRPFLDVSKKLYFFSNGSSRPIDALGDEVRVYSGVLSAERIAAIYSGVPTVSAGTDFSTTGDMAVLHGSVGSDTGDSFRSGHYGDVAWSLVSAPAGGEVAVFTRGANPETEVTLPVEGEYVFRLSVANEGFARHDDITVTRVSSPSGSAPTVMAYAQSTITLPLKGWLKASSADAESVWWSKVSGPGGVWFDVDGAGNGNVSFSAAGTYVLSCNAANAAGITSDEMSVTVESGDVVDVPSDNLQLHFSFNTNKVWKESVRGTDFSTKLTQLGGTAAELVPGLKAFGFRVVPSQASLKVPSTWETKDSGDKITTPDYLTFSAWMKYDPDSDENGSELPFVMINHNSCCLRMGRAVGNSSTGIVCGGEGMTLCQQNGGGTSMSGLTCDFAGLPSITGRWTHVCAILPRVSGAKDDFEIWIDGIKRTLTAVSGYGTFPRPGRDTGSGWDVGGYGSVITANYNLFANATNRVDGGYRSSTFPGVLDEVRFYSAKLSASQIRALAKERDAGRNLAPAVDDPVALPLRAMVREDLPLSLGVYDDGLPAGGTLSCEWKVVSGSTGDVSFADATSATTTVRFDKAGSYALQLVATDGERTTYSRRVPVEVQAWGMLLIYR